MGTRSTEALRDRRLRVPPRTARLRRLGAAAALAAVAAVILFASPARAAGAGYVRLAHLSPDTPAVDVYLRSTSDAVKPQTFKGVAYGAHVGLPASAHRHLPGRHAQGRRGRPAPNR